MPTPLLNVLMIALMIFGFGFVVFFHEMGHFLAAKWVGIKVEQFAVGFGHALFAFRKGLGWRIGTTTPEFMKRVEQHLAAQDKSSDESGDKPKYTPEQIRRGAEELGLSETEYRLNWIPLGGYVKMLGQDDLKPGEEVADPRAYNQKSIGQRMVVVSAGVIMNIILAVIGFTVVFRIGFNVPPAVLGSVMPGSPAQKAGLHPGDRILTMDGTWQYDFTKVGLNTALMKEGADVTIEYEPAGQPGVKKTTTIRGDRRENDTKGFLQIGVSAAEQLTGQDSKSMPPKMFAELTDPATNIADRGKIHLDDTITAINGVPVKVNESYKLDEALQNGSGEPVSLKVRNLAGEERTETLSPYFEGPFKVSSSINFAGMQTLPSAVGIFGEKIKGKIKPGDVFLSVTLADLKQFPTAIDLQNLANRAYEEGKKLKVEVLRDGNPTPVVINDVEAAERTDKARHGLGIRLGMAERVLIISSIVDDSPAKRANIPPGARITQVDGTKVTNWFQVRALLSKAAGEHKIVADVPQVKEPQTFTLTLSATDIENLANMRAGHYAMLRELREPRKTSSAVTAAEWGAIETRDFVLQFYLTLKRMFQGSVSVGNMMGPVGIVSAGAQFASKGMDWLIWFLAMISANLAVVNFLPIPIVDGGLFTFLIIEKIQGKPLSQRTQAVAQIVGFALIISVFLLVTYNDIARQFGR